MSAATLFLVPDFHGSPGGIARYCRLTAQALHEAGVDMRVVALMDTPGTASMLLPAESYTPCGGSRPAYVRQATRATLQARPRLILAGHVNLAPLGWTLARLARAPLATFVYGIDAWTPLSWTRRSAVQRSDRIIAISRYTATQAAKANALHPSRLRVLHNCLDPQFELAPARPRRNGPPSLLTVARMSLAEQYKGHDLVIRAMPELLRRLPDLHYDIVGDGDARPGLEALAQQVGVADAVRFHGLVPEAALRQHYTEASLFIMPSRAEGFGFVFLEAMAHGLPAIGGNMDATPEVIVDGETGLLVDPTSVEAVVAAVSRLLQDNDLRVRMGEAAQRHVAGKFSYQGFRRQLVEELAQVAPAILSGRS